MERKYEFTGETRQIEGRTLNRIVAVRDFGEVKRGEKGGWIEREENLSQQYGDCWVYDNAQVHGDAKVYGNAEVHENADVSGEAVICDNADVTE